MKERIATMKKLMVRATEFETIGAHWKVATTFMSVLFVEKLKARGDVNATVGMHPLFPRVVETPLYVDCLLTQQLVELNPHGFTVFGSHVGGT